MQHNAESVARPLGRMEAYSVLREVLDDAESSLRCGDFNRLGKVIFVWSQRKDHILNGEETWADQNIGPCTWGAQSDGNDRPFSTQPGFRWTTHNDGSPDA